MGALGTKSADAPNGRAEPYPSRRLAAVGIALIVIVLAAAGAGIWDRRKEAISQARQEITDLGSTLAEQTDRSMLSVDLALREIQAKILASPISDPEQFDHLVEGQTIHELLYRRLRGLPEADLVGLIGADGKLLANSHTSPIPAADLRNQEYFEYLRAHDAPDLHISTSTIEKDNRISCFFLARRIELPDGQLLGIAVIAVNIDDLEAVYRTIVRNMGGSVDVFRSSGEILVRYPDQPGGHAADGAHQLVSVRPLGHFPLVVAVSVPEETVLAGWCRRSTLIAVGAICLAVILAVLFRVLAKRSRLLERSEADLRENEARFRDFALTSSDWLWETDAQHRFVFQSEQIRRFGQDPRSRLGRLRIDLAVDVEKEPEKWREHMTVLNAHEPFRNFVYARQIGLDPQHIISVSGKPVFDPAGRFLGYRGTARNITEEVLAERSLHAAKAAAESANLAKSHFLANMSHELRTPLNAILGFAELLERGVAGPLTPRGQEYAGLIAQSGAHLLDVINELLDLARIDAGKLELQEERGIDPRRLIEQCVRLVERQADAAALDLSVEIADPTPLLVADRTRLTEILLNLLSNAIKFTEPGGSVAIATHRTVEGEVAFEVRDTGIGMTKPEIEIALEPFGQVDPGLCRRSAGAGLGLPLARRLAEMHGGSLDIRSEKGTGTTVTLLLPAARVLDDPVIAEASAGTAVRK